MPDEYSSWPEFGQVSGTAQLCRGRGKGFWLARFWPGSKGGGTESHHHFLTKVHEILKLSDSRSLFVPSSSIPIDAVTDPVIDCLT